MTDEKKKPMYMGDPKASQKEIDWLLSQSLRPIEPDKIMELAKAAGDTYEHFLKTLAPKMTHSRALRIRELRSQHSYRIVAGVSWMEWGDDWFPQTNQIAGMVLCRLAAEFLHEDHMQPPWEPLSQ